MTVGISAFIVHLITMILFGLLCASKCHDNQGRFLEHIVVIQSILLWWVIILSLIYIIARYITVGISAAIDH